MAWFKFDTYTNAVIDDGGPPPGDAERVRGQGLIRRIMIYLPKGTNFSAPGQVQVYAVRPDSQPAVYEWATAFTLSPIDATNAAVYRAYSSEFSNALSYRWATTAGGVTLPGGPERPLWRPIPRGVQ